MYLQLHGRKQHIRALLIDRVMLQHEASSLRPQAFCFVFFLPRLIENVFYQLRKLTMEGCQYRSIHQELMRDLLRLSTSTYSQVS